MLAPRERFGEERQRGVQRRFKAERRIEQRRWGATVVKVSTTASGAPGAAEVLVISHGSPHVCVHCRYRSTELLWQCPQCHEWNSFVEERMSTAKDAATAELAEP